LLEKAYNGAHILCQQFTGIRGNWSFYSTVKFARGGDTPEKDFLVEEKRADIMNDPYIMN